MLRGGDFHPHTQRGDRDLGDHQITLQEPANVTLIDLRGVAPFALFLGNDIPRGDVAGQHVIAALGEEVDNARIQRL